MIPLSVPLLNGNEWKYVKECLDTGWISSAGSYVNQFEQMVAEYAGAKYGVACMNGTAGLHIAQILAVWFNSYFPQLLASFGKKYNFKLIHISTDCVFSGKEGGYKEDSFKNGIGFYAQSKALGEVVNSKDLTFRTSIVGPELKPDGIGLFHWFMNQAGAISGFTEVFWTGVTTIELAKAINEAIIQELTGLYHLTNNGCAINNWTVS